MAKLCLLLLLLLLLLAPPLPPRPLAACCVAVVSAAIVEPGPLGPPDPLDLVSPRERAAEAARFREGAARAAARAPGLRAAFSRARSSSSSSSAPEQVHVALAPSPPSPDIAMSACWVTWENASAPLCEFGTAPGQYADRAPGWTRTYDEGLCILGFDCGWKGFVRCCVMRGLRPRTRYYYRVGDAAGHWSEEFDFSTMGAAGEAGTTVAIFGDMGTPPGGFDGEETTRRLTNFMRTSGVDIVVLAGDLAYAYGYQFLWDNFNRQIESFAAHVPFMVGVGNHESPFDFVAFATRYEMPASSAPGSNPPFWYSFDHGLVHFTLYSTEHPLGPGSPQYEWLVRDLAAADRPAQRRARPWVVAVAHRPMYCSNTYISCHEGDRLRSVLERVFRNYSVDLAFHGHVHAYERCRPIFNGSSVRDPRDTDHVYHNPQATVYSLVGMAGALCCGAWWSDPQPEWSVVRYSLDFGYSYFHVYNSSALRFEFRRNFDDEIFDHFSILAASHNFSSRTSGTKQK